MYIWVTTLLLRQACRHVPSCHTLTIVLFLHANNLSMVNFQNAKSDESDQLGISRVLA